MSFFKSGKYKMGGGGDKTKTSTPSPKGQFHVITASPAANSKSSKGKAPTAPTDGNKDVSKIRFSNKTPYTWKLKTLGNFFPEEVTAGESVLICVEKDQGPVQAAYIIEIKESGKAPKIYEFQLKLAKNDGVYELLVDWMSLTKVSGISFKPDLSGSNQPLNLGSNETSVELEIIS